MADGVSSPTASARGRFRKLTSSQSSPAKSRAAATSSSGATSRAVLSNSRSEPVDDPSVEMAAAPPYHRPPRTPTKPKSMKQQIITPESLRKSRAPRPSSSAAAPSGGPLASPDPFDDWPASDDEAMAEVAEQVEAQRPPAAAAPLQPHTPRKAARTDAVSSPGRRPPPPLGDAPVTYPSWDDSDGDFLTPEHDRHPSATQQPVPGLLSPADTPAAARTVAYAPLPPDPGSPTPSRRGAATALSGLALDAAAASSPLFPTAAPDANAGDGGTPRPEPGSTGAAILDTLRDLDVPLTDAVVRAMRALGGRADRQRKAMEKGRDASRAAADRHKEMLAKQADVIARVEAENARLKEVVSCLRRERDGRA